MNKYHIRFNHQHKNTSEVWRVFENGKEHLAESVRIIGDMFTECTEEHGEIKYNIACYGRLLWQENIAIIVNGKD